MEFKKEKKPGDYPIQSEIMSSTDCGIGACKPIGLQCCATMGYFTAVYGVSGIVTSSLQAYINSQITTLEKQFGFSSSVSGLILSCNDIGYLLTTLFMSYIARRTHIPRVLALSTMFFGFSGIVCSIPHFLNMDSFRLNDGADNTSTVSVSPLLQDGALCMDNYLGINGTDQCGGPSALGNDDATVRTVAIVFICIGMFLQGIGKSPRFPFLATYVDDNIEQTQTPMYLGIVIAMSIFGPALGFTLGGLFSRLYVTLEATTMSVRDPRWIGAWWLGFVCFGSLGVVVGLPLCLFPRTLTSRPRHISDMNRRRENKTTKTTVCSDLKELTRSVCRLLSSPIYMCCILAVCSHLFAVSGSMAFRPKYLESQYRISTWKANILFGSVSVFGASCGALAGGYFTTKLKLKPLTCLKVNTGLIFLTLLLVSTGFFLGCSPPEIHMGGHRVYNTSSGHGMQMNNVTFSTVQCDVDTCVCDDTQYFPICGSDKKNYFSPCHAGCNSTSEMVYGNCSCIGEGATGKPGLCADECETNLRLYVSANFFTSVVAASSLMPNFVVFVRSIRESDKPLGVGLSSFLFTLLGFLPGAVVYGKFIDTSCLIWSTTCSGREFCSLYDSDDFRVKLHALLTMSKVIGTLLLILALIIALKMKQPFFIDAGDPQTIAETELMLTKKDQILQTKGTKV